MSCCVRLGAVFLALLVASSSFAQQFGFRGRLPRGWRSAGITLTQKTAIYDLQKSYFLKLEKAEQDITGLKQQQEIDLACVLSKQQRAFLVTQAKLTKEIATKADKAGPKNFGQLLVKGYRGRLPSGWRAAGVNALQKAIIYGVQGYYARRIGKLTADKEKLERELLLGQIQLLSDEQQQFLVTKAYLKKADVEAARKAKVIDEAAKKAKVIEAKQNSK
ncbi:MAG: hypothetical protein ACFCD0_22540 [Gemmataceae bacterium]